MKRQMRFSVFVLSALLLIFGAFNAKSQDISTSATGTPSKSDVPKIEFEKYALPNGLLHVDRKLPMVHVNNWYHVGSKNERVGRTGFAHLFDIRSTRSTATPTRGETPG